MEPGAELDSAPRVLYALREDWGGHPMAYVLGRTVDRAGLSASPGILFGLCVLIFGGGGAVWGPPWAALL